MKRNPLPPTLLLLTLTILLNSCGKSVTTASSTPSTNTTTGRYTTTTATGEKMDRLDRSRIDHHRIYGWRFRPGPIQ